MILLRAAAACLVVVICVQAAGAAGEYDETLALAEQAYRDGLYDVALGQVEGLAGLRVRGRDGGRLHYLMAQCLVKKGETARAVREYEVVIRQFEDSPWREKAVVRIAEVHYENDDCQGLTAAALQIASLYPESPFVPVSEFWTGACLEKQGKLKEAADVWSGLLEARPGWSHAEYCELRYALLLYRMGHAEAAAKRFANVQEKMPAEKFASLAAYGRAECFFVMGRFREASRGFERVLGRYPGGRFEPPALLGLGQCFYKLKQYGKAKTAFDRLLEEHAGTPEAQRAQYMDGWLELALGRPAAAVERFREFAGKHGDSSLAPEAFFFAGVSALHAGDKDSAESAWKSVMAGFPGDRWTQAAALLLGTVRLAGDDTAGARSAFVAAADEKLDKGLAGMARYSEGLCLSREGDWPGAEVAFSGASKLLGEDRLAAQSRLRLSLSQYMSGKHEQAGKGLAAMLGSAGSLQSEVIYWLGHVRLAEGRFEDAIECFSSIVGKGKEEEFTPLAQYGLALTRRAQGRKEEALQALDALVRRYSRSELASRARIELGDAMLALGKGREARARYEKVVSGGSAEFAPLALFSIGYGQYSESDFQGALGSFTRLRDEFGSSPLAGDALLWEAWCEYRMGENEDAFAALELLLEKFPRTDLAPEVLYSMGNVRLAEGSSADARGYYERVVSSFPDSGRVAEARLRAALACELDGDMEAAREGVEAVAANHAGTPAAAQAFLWIGQYEERKGELDKGEAAFLQVLANYKGPAKADAHYWLGRIYLQRGRRDKAGDEFSAAVTDASGRWLAEAEVSLAEMHRAEKRCEKAIEVCGRVLGRGGIRPGTVRTARFVRGACLQALGRHAEAVNEFQQVLGVADEMEAETQFRIGVCHERLGQVQEAAVEYLKVVYFHTMYPQWVLKAEQRAAECFESRRMWDEAGRLYEKIIRTNPEGVHGVKARAALEHVEQKRREEVFRLGPDLPWR